MTYGRTYKPLVSKLDDRVLAYPYHSLRSCMRHKSSATQTYSLRPQPADHPTTNVKGEPWVMGNIKALSQIDSRIHPDAKGHDPVRSALFKSTMNQIKTEGKQGRA